MMRQLIQRGAAATWAVDAHVRRDLSGSGILLSIGVSILGARYSGERSDGRCSLLHEPGLQVACAIGENSFMRNM